MANEIKPNAVKAVRTWSGSSMGEYLIFDANGKYLQYWSVYRDGKLPANIHIVYNRFE